MGGKERNGLKTGEVCEVGRCARWGDFTLDQMKLIVLEMNWVGGARRRICKTDIKTAKGQRKLQKEYFERRRLGTLNLNAVGKIPKRNQPLKDTKCQISQDILDFQNHKHHGEGVVHSNKARAAFRVVNLNKKIAPSKLPDTNNARYETVELPLSPVEKQSALQLSHSPTSQEESTDSSLSNDWQYPSTYLASNKFNVNPSHGKERQKYQPPNNLQLFNKRGLENLPLLLLGKHAPSSTIDLFGTTMTKPRRCDKSIAMPPPSYGISSTKAKRKKLMPQIPRTHDKMSTRFSNDSDYPTDDTTPSHYSQTNSHRDFLIPDQYQTTPPHMYCPKADNNNRIFNDIQLIPSQSSCSLKNNFSHEANDMHGSDFEAKSNSFKLFSPLTASDFVDAREPERNTDRKLPGAFFDRFDNHDQSPQVESYYPPPFQVSTNTDRRQVPPQSTGHDLFSELNIDFDNRSFSNCSDKCQENNYSYGSNTFSPLGRDRNFMSNQENDNNSLCSTNETIISSETFDFGRRKHAKNIQCPNSFRFSDKALFNDCFSSYSSMCHLEKSDNSGRDGNMLINQSLTAEWYNDSREPTRSANLYLDLLTSREHISISQRDISNVSMKKDKSIVCVKDPHRLSRFATDTNMKCFEPLETSTPYSPPICLNKEVMDIDVDRHKPSHSHSMTALNKDKILPMNDLLNEMMDLETQSEKPAIKTEKYSSKDVAQAHHENDKVVVADLLSELVSRVEVNIQESKRKGMECISISPQQVQVVAKTDQKTQAWSRDNTSQNDASSRMVLSENENHCQSIKSSQRPKITNSQKKMAVTDCIEKGCMPATSETMSTGQYGSLRECVVTLEKIPNSQMIGQYRIYDRHAGNSESSGEQIKKDKSKVEIQDETKTKSASSTYIRDVFTPDVNHVTPTANTNDHLQQSLINQNKINYISGTSTKQNDITTVTVNEVASEKQPCIKKLCECQRVTVSTQTFQKEFTDTACSPIVIFPLDHYVENDFGKIKSVPKVYGLRSRPRFHEDLSKQEE